jgi:phage baseplate assembly protein gpV
MMRDILNAMHGAAAGHLNTVAQTKHGTITSYDPATYRVQVLVQPDDVNSGWIPLQALWVGNGWGLFCAPSIGDAVELHFQEGDGAAPSAALRFFNDQNAPLNCPSGEFWLVHKSGSFFKMLNTGAVTFNDAHGAAMTFTGGGNITSSASNWTHTGPVTFAGNFNVTGTIKATSGDVIADTISLKNHHHSTSGGARP